MDLLTLTIMAAHEPFRPVRFNDERGVWVHVSCARDSPYVAKNADQLVYPDLNESCPMCWACHKETWTS